jgi:hypothetical protein
LLPPSSGRCPDDGGSKDLGTSRFKWKDNIEMDLKEIRYEYVDWIHLV